MHQPLAFFHGWAGRWRRDRSLREELDRVRKLRRRRTRGNQALPHLDPDNEFRRCLAYYPALRAVEVDDSDHPIEQAYQAHRVCIEAFNPVVHRAFWARWLYLERAL